MTYNILIFVISIAFLAVSFLPDILKMRNSLLSIPIIFVGLGIALFHFPIIDINLSNPQKYNEIILRVTEISVIISLMGTGLKIDKVLSFHNWKLTLIFLFGTMALGIMFTTFLGLAFSLGWPLSLLLAASLSPTDPVLASDVQVGPPGEGKEDKVRFTLTTEAGLNDGLAFPFVNLAILLFLNNNISEHISLWVMDDLIYKLTIGVIVGYCCGKLFGHFLFKLPDKIKALDTDMDGFIVIAITLFSYSVTEMIHGYGFLAVFIASIFIRDYERKDRIHYIMHEFSDQNERMIMVTILILFGGFISHGLFNYLSWQDLTFCLLLIFLVRPLTGLISLGFSKISFFERFCISFFGIRGIGSFYYISYAISKIDNLPIGKIWAIVGFTVLLSIIIHGISVTYFFNYLDKKKELKQK